VALFAIALYTELGTLHGAIACFATVAFYAATAGESRVVYNPEVLVTGRAPSLLHTSDGYGKAIEDVDGNNHEHDDDTPDADTGDFAPVEESFVDRATSLASAVFSANPSAETDAAPVVRAHVLDTESDLVRPRDSNDWFGEAWAAVQDAVFAPVLSAGVRSEPFAPYALR
jgi:hypothetical protein